MNNIYVCGDVRSVYIRDFTEKVLKTLGGEKEIFFVSQSTDYDVYNEKYIHFLLNAPQQKTGILSIIGGGWKTSSLKICRNHKPDKFILNYVNPWTIIKYYPLWRKAKKRVLVFWGSDIYKMTERNVRLLAKFLSSVTDMVFMENMAKETQRKLSQVVCDNKVNVKKHIIDFGMPLLDALENVISFPWDFALLLISVKKNLQGLVLMYQMVIFRRHFQKLTLFPM